MVRIAKSGSKKTIKKVTGRSSPIDKSPVKPAKTKDRKRSAGKKKGEISVHISEAAAGKWKQISKPTVDHVRDVIKTSTYSVLTKLNKRDRLEYSMLLDSFSRRFLAKLDSAKVPAKRAQPYSQLRKNLARLDDLITSSENRMNKIELETSKYEKEIEDMETYIDCPVEDRKLIQLDESDWESDSD